MKLLPLELFNERLEKIGRCRLSQRMENPHYKIQYEKVMNRGWIAVDGLSEDDVEAFVLNLRLLVQDRNGFSIRCLSEIYEDSCISAELRREYKEQREIWRQHLEGQSAVRNHGTASNYMNGELFKIILYGGFAHQNVKYSAEFYFLTRQGAFSGFVCASFLVSLRLLLGVVRNIRQINKTLLQLERGPGGELADGV